MWPKQGSGKDGDVDNKGTLGPLGKKKPYCLRVHVFQCRDLPSSDANGLLDPYVKVRACVVTKEGLERAAATTLCS